MVFGFVVQVCAWALLPRRVPISEVSQTLLHSQFLPRGSLLEASVFLVEWVWPFCAVSTDSEACLSSDVDWWTNARRDALG